MLRIIIIVCGVVLAVLLYVFSFLWYPGITPKQTANIITTDEKFGGRALLMADMWGDYILSPMRENTHNFVLKRHTANMMAMILAKNNSTESIKIAEELYRRDSEVKRPAKNDTKRYYEYQTNITYPKLVGMIGLGAHDKLPSDAFDQGSFIYRILSQTPVFSYKNYKYEDDEELNLAITAAQYSKSTKAVPLLIGIIEKRPTGYWTHAKACEALGKIGDKRAILPLREALKADNFHALPEAFRALHDLGDEQAIPLAIARISPEIEKKNSGYVIKELKKVTEKDFGFDQAKWLAWYNQADDKTQN